MNVNEKKDNIDHGQNGVVGDDEKYEIQPRRRIHKKRARRKYVRNGHSPHT